MGPVRVAGAMTAKLALLLLAALLVVGMIGKWRAPKVDRTRGKPIEAARKCVVCDAYVLGGAAGCARADCPQT